jgi:DNA recombination-dependent growth factor C
MGLIKGSAALSRYRVLEEPEPGKVTPEFVQARLKRNAFVDIETAPEESSVGWVEILDHLSMGFEGGTFDFGDFMGFTLRLDERRLPAKTLNRYYAIAEAKFVKENGKRPNSLKKNQIKESLRLDLLRRSLLSTSLWQVAWLTGRSEVWLDASGEKARTLFEDQWARTFGLGLRLLVPVSLGIEILPESLHERLIRLSPASIWEQGAENG